MDNSGSLNSHALFGVRVDSLTPAQVAVAIWEGVTTRREMMVVLADVWTLLLAQREYAMWEALVASDFVLPVEDDAVIRRLAHRLHIPVVQPGLLLHDLCGAAMQTQKKVTFVGPEDEIESDVALVRRIWPTLKLGGVSRWSAVGAEPDDVMVRKLNDEAADLFIVGGETFWQEDFMHARRDALTTKVIVLLPTLHTALAAVAQHSGVPVSSIGRLRRKAALQRAYATTIAPAASASAAAMGTLLQGARHGISDISAAFHAQRPPAALRRLQGLQGLQRLRAPAERTVAVRMTEWRDPGESEIMRRLITSPLTRITPRPMPALPPPKPPQVVVVEDESGGWMADQPTVSLTLDAIRDSIPSSLGPLANPSMDSSSRNPAANGHIPGGIPIPPSNSGVMPIPGGSLPGVARPAAPYPAASTPAASAPGAPPSAAASGAFPSQLAPTTQLGRPPAPSNATPPAREPVPDALAPTTRLRRPPPPAPATPAPPEDAPATMVYDDASAAEAPPAAAVSDPATSQGHAPVRIVRKYVVKRARRKAPRKRPPQRRPST
ncbi:MAG TPA: hypothetical protein VID73_10630 [Ktedonobacterales bacterium]